MEKRLNARTLILNSSYEPLLVCNVKKAIIMILQEKVELIVADKIKVIRTATSTMAWPTVVRLKRYVHVPHKEVVASKKNILRRDGFKCAYCGRGDLSLTLDHIIPKSRGGSDTWNNLITACVKCNNRKDDRTPEEANMPLHFKAFTPSHILFIRNSITRMNPDWEPYLYYRNK